MNLMSYLLQANIYLLLFFLFYAVFLQRETFFNWIEFIWLEQHY
jgi:hypothetical protein